MMNLMNLMKEEKVDLILHSGDLNYTSNVTTFEHQLENAGFGMDFPILYTPGNYEGSAHHTDRAPPPWPLYARERLKRISRLAEIGILSCLPM